MNFKPREKKAQNSRKHQLRNRILLYPIPNLLRSSLALLGLFGLASLALKDSLTVPIELQLGDDDLGGVDADWDGLKVGLLVGDALNVDNVFEAVDRSDLPLLALV